MVVQLNPVIFNPISLPSFSFDRPIELGLAAGQLSNNNLQGVYVPNLGLGGPTVWALNQCYGSTHIPNPSTHPHTHTRSLQDSIKQKEGT